MQDCRLKSGGRIERAQPLRFYFNGRAYQGYAGDTLASALLANGIKVVGRSFKLHRPRGIVGIGSEEPNAILQIGGGALTLPNQRATEVELYDGLQAWSVRGWPSLGFDIGAVTNWLSRFLPAGFYYKTFMAPRSLWSFYEKLIRRSAGWGIAPAEPDPDNYEHCNAHCDVLVVGAGPAGLLAALTAAKSGARVILADEQSELGGRLLSDSEMIDGKDAEEWLRSTVLALQQFENVTLLTRSTVFGYFDQNFLTIAERCNESGVAGNSAAVRQRMWRVRAREVVLAQGAFERPLVFCNNDRPGVMLASAVSAYLNRYAVQPGREAVVFTNNDFAYRTALDLHRVGARVVAIVDCREEGAADLQREAEALGMRVMTGHVVTDVTGSHQVTGVRVAAYLPTTAGADSRIEQAPIEIRCDLVAMSGGWSPAVHLHSQSGGRNRWSDSLQCIVPDRALQNCQSAGAGNGAWSLQECLRQGLDAGQAAVTRCGLQVVDVQLPSCTEVQTNPQQALWRVPAHQSPDRCPKQFLAIDQVNTRAAAKCRKRQPGRGLGQSIARMHGLGPEAVRSETLGETADRVR